jgi:hypothetical protein
MCKGVTLAKSNSIEIGVRSWRITPGVLHAKRPPRKRLRSNGENGNNQLVHHGSYRGEIAGRLIAKAEDLPGSTVLKFKRI